MKFLSLCFVITKTLHLTKSKFKIMSLNVKVRALKYHRFDGELRSTGDVYSVKDQELVEKLIKKGNVELAKPDKADKLAKTEPAS